MSMDIKVFVPVETGPVLENDIIHIPNTEGKTLSEKISYMNRYHADWYIFRHDDLTMQAPLADIVPMLEIMDRENVGVAGVIGTLCLYNSCMWWSPMRPQVTVGAITQGFGDGQPDVLMADGPGLRTDAVSVDGCFMAFSRKFLEQYEAHPFHWRFGYDVDACLQALEKGFKVGIVPFPCRHQSEGKFDPVEFGEARDRLLEYWGAKVDFPVINSSKFVDRK